MRTTLDMPKELLDEALRLTGCRTKTRVITLALENLVRKEKIAGLKKFKGTLKLEIDLDSLRQR